MNEQPKPNKKPFFYYAMIAMLILMLLNAFVFPSLMTPRVTEVSYDKFLDMLSGGQVTVVELQENERELYFKAADENGAERIYSTGVFPDADLQKRLSESGVTFSAVAPQENSTLMNFLFTWIFPTLILILPMVLLWRMMQKRMGDGSNMMSFGMGKSNAKMYVAAQTGKTFADVAGQEEAKEALEEIVDFLHNPDKYRSVGAVMPKGVLLVGPPGTGKTLLAKAVAGEANVPFFSMSGSDFVEMFVGVGASRVRDLFRQAKEKAPCIVFIDEIDAVGRARGRNANMGSNDERENTLNQLLTEMDGFGSNSGVICLAATNRVDILDKALLRAGRFDRQIYVDLPDVHDRVAIFNVHLRKIKKDDNLDVELLARQTAGFSGADIANVCNEAALIAARNNKSVVDFNDFNAAIDRIIGGLEKKSKITTDEEKRGIAVHEAGHATVSWHLRYGDPLVKVTIVPRGKALGAAWYLPEERQLVPSQALLDKICSLMGGRAAEDLFIGQVATGALNDLERATKIAYSLVVYYGMSDKIPNISYYDSTGQDYGFSKPYSEERSKVIDQEVSRILNEQYDRAKEILRKYAEGHKKLADLLTEKEVIFTADVEEIFGKRPWTSRADEIMALDEAAKAKAIAQGDGSNSDDRQSDGEKPASGTPALTPPPYNPAKSHGDDSLDTAPAKDDKEDK